MYRKLLVTLSFCLILLALTPQALAGYFEVSASASFRQSVIDDNNFTELFSTTASASYYFMSLSALEFSFTNGTSTLSSKPSDPAESKIVIETEFKMKGLDLVLSFADRKSALQPYLKGGVAQITKKITRKQDNLPAVEISNETNTVPSAGVGIKIKITDTFSIKAGIDAWENKSDGSEKSSYDYAGRAGISWLF